MARQNKVVKFAKKKIKTNNALLPYSYFHMHNFLSDLYLVTGLFRKMPYKTPSQYTDSLQWRVRVRPGEVGLTSNIPIAYIHVLLSVKQSPLFDPCPLVKGSILE